MMRNASIGHAESLCHRPHLNCLRATGDEELLGRIEDGRFRLVRPATDPLRRNVHILP